MQASSSERTTTIRTTAITTFLSALAIAVCSGSAMSDDSASDFKLHECDGERKLQVQVSKPDDGRMQVRALGFTAHVYVHPATLEYRADLNGWGSNFKNLEGALNYACRRIIENAGSPSEEELRKMLDAFYDDLK